MTDYTSLVADDRVHGDIYIDPNVFEAELDAIFAKAWVFIGHASEVPKTGDFKRKSIGRAPVIFCRDETGSVRVLMNRCRHRAATVCQEDCGQTKRFRCEYHGWTYRLDGTLDLIPYADAYDDIDRSTLSLSKPARVDQYRGFVFASLTAAGESLDDFLGPAVRGQIDNFCDLSPLGEIEVRAGAALLAYDGNWKLQMENSIDGYHPNFTHQSFFQAVFVQTGQRVATFDGDSDAQTRAMGHGHTLLDYSRPNLTRAHVRHRIDGLERSPWGRDYVAAMVDAHGVERAHEVIALGGTHMNVFPNLVLLNQQVRTIHPIAHNRTEVTLAPALLKGVPDEINTQRIRQFEAFYSPHGGGIHDDIEMFNRVFEGLQCAQDPWLLFKRGIHREEQAEDGTTVAHVTDELPQRAMYRYWKERMQG